jgi:hypothetical protein
VVCKLYFPSLDNIDFSGDFEKGILVFLIGIFPSCFASKAHRGRATIQSLLGSYYAAKLDLQPDVFTIKRRTEVFREYNMTPTHIGQWEIAIINASTQNTVPTGFWMMIYIASNGPLTDVIR